MNKRPFRKQPRDMDAVLQQWITAQGFNNAGLWQQLGVALREALPAQWHSHVQVCSIRGSQVSVSVDSAALLAELTSFHASRLRVALQNAAPGHGIREVKFVLAE